MKVAGIIAEYNPFHNGHKYQIDEVRRLTGADYVIAVMSPDFVQRGSLALADKYVRAKAALSCGVDLCLELPVTFATGSAELFAAGGVKILKDIGVVDLISFGCEQPVTDEVHRLVKVLCTEPEDYRVLLQKSLKRGLSFPAAREEALSAYLGSLSPACKTWLSSSNCTLALEYLKAMLQYHADFEALPILRSGSGYNDTELTQGQMPSASAIRRYLNENSLTQIQPMFPGASTTLAESTDNSETASLLTHYLPSEVLHVLNAHAKQLCPATPAAYDRLLYYRLLTEPCYEKYLDISEDLAKRIRNLLPEYTTAEDFALLLKTKQMTLTRIRRGLLHMYLGIETDFALALHRQQTAPYAKILGFRKDASPLMHALKEKSRIPLITRPAEGRELKDPLARQSFELDLKASQLYRLSTAEVTANAVGRENVGRPIIMN